MAGPIVSFTPGYNSSRAWAMICELECQNADFSGTIKAKVTVEQLLSLKATAKFNGDVITNKISIEPGAKFTGTCNMDGGVNKPQPNVTTPPEQKEKTFK